MPRNALKVDRLLDLDAVAERLGGIAKSTLYSLADRGEFPIRKLGPRLSRVRESDLEDFIARIPEGRSSSPNPRAHDGDGGIDASRQKTLSGRSLGRHRTGVERIAVVPPAERVP